MSKYDQGVYACMYCLNWFYFCHECFPKHQAGSIPYKLCDSDHEFVYSVGAPKDLPADKVKVGGKIRNREEWLDEIRERWDLPLKKSDSAAPPSSDIAPALK